MQVGTNKEKHLKWLDYYSNIYIYIYIYIYINKKMDKHKIE